MRVNGKWYSVLTIAIVMLIGLVFLLTNVPIVQQVIARASSMPHYHSDSDAICLITVYEGNAEELLSIAQNASEDNVPLTIGVTAQQLIESPFLAKEIQLLGHALALYGQRREEGENSVEWEAKSMGELNEFIRITQDSDVLYIPYLGQHTSDAAKFCHQNNMVYLLYCKDSRMYEAESQKLFAQALAQNAYKGDFIYVGIDKTSDFGTISREFAKRYLTLDTANNVLSN